MTKKIRWCVETTAFEWLNLDKCGLIRIGNEYMDCVDARVRYDLLVDLLNEEEGADISIYDGDNWHIVRDVFKCYSGRI